MDPRLVCVDSPHGQEAPVCLEAPQDPALPGGGEKEKGEWQRKTSSGPSEQEKGVTQS